MQKSRIWVWLSRRKISCQPRWTINWASVGESQLHSSWQDFSQHVQEGDPSRSCSACLWGHTWDTEKFSALCCSKRQMYWTKSSAGPLGGWQLEHPKWWILHPQRRSKCDWRRSCQPALLDLLPTAGWVTQLPKDPSTYMLLWFWWISCVSNLLFSVAFYLFNYVLNLIN